jgi:hypothetical protein
MYWQTYESMNLMKDDVIKTLLSMQCTDVRGKWHSPEQIVVAYISLSKGTEWHPMERGQTAQERVRVTSRQHCNIPRGFVKARHSLTSRGIIKSSGKIMCHGKGLRYDRCKLHYGSLTWFLTMGKQHRLRVYENRVLKRIHMDQRHRDRK